MPTAHSASASGSAFDGSLASEILKNLTLRRDARQPDVRSQGHRVTHSNECPTTNDALHPSINADSAVIYLADMHALMTRVGRLCFVEADGLPDVAGDDLDAGG